MSAPKGNRHEAVAGGKTPSIASTMLSSNMFVGRKRFQLCELEIARVADLAKEKEGR